MDNISIDAVSQFDLFVQWVMSGVAQIVTNPTVQYITIFIIAEMVFSRLSFNFAVGGGIVSRLLNGIIVVVHAMTVAAAVLHVYRG